jgi:hypothetical protein
MSSPKDGKPQPAHARSEVFDSIRIVGSEIALMFIHQVHCDLVHLGGLVERSADKKYLFHDSGSNGSGQFNDRALSLMEYLVKRSLIQTFLYLLLTSVD